MKSEQWGGIDEYCTGGGERSNRLRHDVNIMNEKGGGVLCVTSSPHVCSRATHPPHTATRSHNVTRERAFILETALKHTCFCISFQ